MQRWFRNKRPTCWSISTTITSGVLRALQSSRWAWASHLAGEEGGGPRGHPCDQGLPNSPRTSPGDGRERIRPQYSRARTRPWAFSPCRMVDHDDKGWAPSSSRRVRRPDRAAARRAAFWKSARACARQSVVPKDISRDRRHGGLTTRSTARAAASTIPSGTGIHGPLEKDPESLLDLTVASWPSVGAGRRRSRHVV